MRPLVHSPRRPGVVASSLSFGSGVIVVFLFTGSPDRVSALSGRATKARIRPVIRGHQPEGAGQPVAVSCRLSATGVRFSVIRFPPGVAPSSRSAYRRQDGPDPDGVTAFRTHEQRPGWVPSIPRGQRCSPRPSRPDRPASAASQRPVPVPRSGIPPGEASASRGINEGSSNSPVRSSPRPQPPGWNGRCFGFPPSFAPRRPRAGQRTSGWGQAIEHGPGNALRHQSNLQSSVVHSWCATSRRTGEAVASGLARRAAAVVSLGERGARLIDGVRPSGKHPPAQAALGVVENDPAHAELIPARQRFSISRSSTGYTPR